MAVLNDLKDEMKRVHTVLWADDIAVEFGYQALTTGVRGILRKAWSGELLVKSIEMVAAGDLCYEKVLSDQFLMSRRKAVTHQEGRIIGLLVRGKKNKEIAWELHITEGTIKVYFSRLFDKLGVSDRYELALYGIRNLGYDSHPESGAAVVRTFIAALDPPPPLPEQG